MSAGVLHVPCTLYSPRLSVDPVAHARPSAPNTVTVVFASGFVLVTAPTTLKLVVAPGVAPLSAA